MKICSKCIIPKKLEHFHKNNTTRDKHSDKCKECTSKYNKKRQPIRNAQDRERRIIDPKFKILCSLRARICQILKKDKVRKTNSTLNLLGCSLEEFKLYLEKQFKPEMNWENHGLVWENDHTIPCDFFNLTNIEEQKQCFHYTNLQPLFKTTEIAINFGYNNEIGNRNKSNNL